MVVDMLFTKQETEKAQESKKAFFVFYRYYKLKNVLGTKLVSELPWPRVSEQYESAETAAASMVSLKLVQP